MKYLTAFTQYFTYKNQLYSYNFSKNNKESANQSPIVSTQSVLGLYLNLHRSTALIVSKYQHFTHQHTQVIISISELQ